MSEINLKAVDEEKNGQILLKQIKDAEFGDVIELPQERIKLHSLIINKPLTLQGKPGTIIEICGGQIIIDFNHEK